MSTSTKSFGLGSGVDIKSVSEDSRDPVFWTETLPAWGRLTRAAGGDGKSEEELQEGKAEAAEDVGSEPASEPELPSEEELFRLLSDPSTKILTAAVPRGKGSGGAFFIDNVNHFSSQGGLQNVLGLLLRRLKSLTEDAADSSKRDGLLPFITDLLAILAHPYYVYCRSLALGLSTPLISQIFDTLTSLPDESMGVMKKDALEVGHNAATWPRSALNHSVSCSLMLYLWCSALESPRDAFFHAP